ncbi:hypothetical protein EDEG_03931 [Edhazardia aedis USNM 41457]|uniref:Uncharacterized protein n=1 Tax=Edhazardia aedis (strain USNM 41457) TaxID=1003232 RepID=J9DFW1_EDHAE|nr:hypothetical protein EDEG_03931 [Edhazardia aedis USNM 41457]|eukprot:EJW01490.1 hypothetical protein EDEG_03931 [Edhazardia aedis USNM 41457]
MQPFFIISAVFSSNNTNENLKESFVDLFGSIQSVHSNHITEDILSSQLNYAKSCLHEKNKYFLSIAIEKETNINDTINPAIQTEKINKDSSFSKTETSSKVKIIYSNSSDKYFLGFCLPADSDKTACDSIGRSQSQNMLKFRKKFQREKQEKHCGRGQSSYSYSPQNLYRMTSDHSESVEKKDF